MTKDFKIKLPLCISYFIVVFIVPNVGIPVKYDFIFRYLFLVPLILSLVFFILFHRMLYQALLEIKWIKLFLLTSICIASSLVIDTIVSNQNSLSLSTLSSNELKKVIIAATTYGAFLEEMIFRFSLINLASNKKKIVFLFISSFLFSIAHGGNFSIFVLGILLGVIYIKNSNIWYPILVHIFYNTFVILIHVFFN